MQRTQQLIDERVESSWDAKTIAVLSHKDFKKQRRTRFQKEDGDCGSKVPKGHPEDVHKVPKGSWGARGR